ncbi:MAG: effector binding domain-containing protein [Oscillospiraceae bacterium]|nr:effector binding domain-containing protein [Oscillospiraceae bacterium]
MELQTVSQVSKTFGISAQMLRYYERSGLLKSLRKDNYAYRVYDDENIKRLQQIIILRKLQIPVKQICVVLANPDTATAIEIFKANISELQNEINALSTIKSALEVFVAKIEELAAVRLNLNLLNDESVIKLAESLSLIQKNVKEIKTMEELNKANDQMNKLTDKDVRIVYLPPVTVAAYQYEGDEPEHAVAIVIDKFVLDNDLPNAKPDLRHFGFNCPNPADETGAHGYEMWVTIPEDMEVSAPLVKKHFPGGLYAAHMIPMGAFEEWEWLFKWSENNAKYEYNGTGSGDNMFGCLEEHLNYKNNVASIKNGVYDGIQLDLLIPIKERGKN